MTEKPALVDLKWSLWSLEKETWDESYPNLWNAMEKAFKGRRAPITIETAPRKEIRFGSVTIREGAADVHFTAEWDNQRVACVEETVLLLNGKDGVFDTLMEMIDHREVDLMRLEHKAYHGRQGTKLQTIRCHHCGYPYHSKTSRRLQ